MGKRAAILPFRAVGVELMAVEEPDALRQAFRDILAGETETLVMLPEDLAAECAAEIRTAREGTAVVVLTLPSANGPIGRQRELVRQLVARSIGVDLMGKNRD
jgi:vacuolar-type H+-ATPase subunit F/Vma7